MRTTWRTTFLVVVCQLIWVRAGRANDPPFPDTANECQSAADQPNWFEFFFPLLLFVVLFGACDDTCFIRPTYHIVNNVTKHADGHASMEPLNDANGIFLYRGIYHVMNQAGGGNWTHVRENLKHVYTSSNSML